MAVMTDNPFFPAIDFDLSQPWELVNLRVREGVQQESGWLTTDKDHGG